MLLTSVENSERLTLDALPRNASATIVRVEGDDAVARRLREMGLLPGQTVRRGRAAPLGDPVVFFVRGFRLALRRSEARRIAVDRASLVSASDDSRLDERIG